MEVVERRVVVELEGVRALGQRPTVQFSPVRIPELDSEVVLDVRGQDPQVVPRDAELPRRVRLADAEDGRVPALARDVDVTAGVLAEGGRIADDEAGRRVFLHVWDLEDVRVDGAIAVVAVDVAAQKARTSWSRTT